MTNRFNLKKVIRLDKCHLYSALAFNSVTSSMVKRAVQTCIITALGDVPTKDLILRFCLIALKKLWKALHNFFRISKTDLKIRPIYHRNEKRIESHICIAFVAYTIYKEVERRLTEKKVSLSPARVAELTKTMYTIKIRIPETDQWEVIPFEWTEEQELVAKIL